MLLSFCMYVTVSHKLLRDHAENRRTTYCVVGKNMKQKKLKKDDNLVSRRSAVKDGMAGKQGGARDDGLEALRETPGRSCFQNGGQNIID